jgi:acetyltransferase (GNAT) family protein
MSSDAPDLDPIQLSAASITSAPASAPANGNDAKQPADPLADVPALSTFTATSESDRLSALKLVADSVAQERQFASRAVLSHPLAGAVFIVVAAVVGNYMVKSSSDWALYMTTMAGICMALLVSVRWMGGGYIQRAEEVASWDWLGDDTVIVTKFGEAVIGALVLGWENGEQGGGGKKGSKKKGKSGGGRGLIRAWTVKLRYRGKGEGRLLLDEAVKVVQQKGGDGLAFAEDNACEYLVVAAVDMSLMCSRFAASVA